MTIHSLAYLSSQNNGDISGSGNLLSQLEGKFWSKMAYIIGKNDEAFSLDDIEHGILRGLYKWKFSNLKPQYIH